MRPRYPQRILPIFLALILMTVVAPIAWGQDAGNDGATDDSTEEPESPLGAQGNLASREAIFEAQLGDADVDLFLAGNWTTGIQGTIGWAFHPSIPPDGKRVTYPYTFPGMEKIPYFNQVDLTVSLWLYERFYFELVFLDDFELNSYVLGYQGKEGEFVQSVRVGKAEFSISEYPYIDFAGTTEPAPGASAVLQTDRSVHEFLLRYEPSAQQSEVFFGLNEVATRRFEPADYVQGRFFVLPDAGVVSLAVYLEDENGTLLADDGRTYTAFSGSGVAEIAEFSNDEGFVYLREPAEGRVLVYYEVAGTPVGDGSLGTGALVGVTGGQLDPPAGPVDFELNPGSPGVPDYLGIDFDALDVNLAGVQALLLYQPGQFSPFEAANRYDVEDLGLVDTSRVELDFVERDGFTGREFESLILFLAPEQDEVVVGAPSVSIRAAENRYPFAGTNPSYPLLYGPAATSKPGYVGFQIYARVLRSVESLQLSGQVVPGSVKVLRNGVEDPSFTVDYETGKLSTPYPIFPSDVIEVTYRTFGPESGGDLLFVSGNTIEVNSQTDLTLALGVRWNILESTYSVTPEDHPGSVTTSAQVDYTTDYLTGLVNGAVQFQIPDTTGILRLLGMEDKRSLLPVSDSLMFPASDPGALVSGARGRLFYKDYYTQDVFGGSTLQDYDFDLPGGNIYPYEEDSRIGPYPADSDDAAFDERVMVLDFDLAEDEWVGANLRVPNTVDRDFSEVSAISFDWSARDLDGTEEIEVYIQAGSVSEDVDGDGGLDAGESFLIPGFDFDDADNGITLLAGLLPPGRTGTLTEDGNLNDILDREVDDLVFTAPEIIASPSVSRVPDVGRPDDTWQRVKINIGASERQKLSATRAVRIVVVETGAAVGSSAVGRILVGDVTFHGTTFAVAPAGDDVLVREVTDRPPGGIPTLVEEFSEVEDVFHPESTTNQRVLEIDWSAPGGTSTWTLSDYVTPTPLDQYESLVFYLRVESLGGPSGLRVAMAEDENDTPSIEGSFTLDASTQRWRKVELDTVSDTIRVDGDSVADLSRSAGGSRRVSYLTFEQTGTDTGVIYLDEVHWSQARVSIEGAGRLAYTWDYPETLWSRGNVEIIKNVVLTQDTATRSKGFSAQSEVTGETGTFSHRTDLAMDLLYTRVETFGSVAVTDERTTGSGGHSLQFPADPGLLTAYESYQRSFNSGLPSLYRSNWLLLSDQDVGSIRFDTDATLRNRNLVQEWSLDGQSLWSDRFAMESAVRFGHRAGGYVLRADDYGESWIDGYSLVAPYQEGDKPSRTGDTEHGLVWSDRFIGTTIDLTLGYENRSAAEGTQSNRGSLSVGFPIAVVDDPPRSMTITPGYSRSFSFTAFEETNDQYGDDLSDFGEDTADQRYLFVSTPFSELAANRERSFFAEDTAAYEYASYTPSVSLGLTRSTHSEIQDLFVPADANTTFGRTLTRQSDALTERYSWSLELTTIALNLFGRFGSHPVFSFYQSDEITNSNTVTIDRTLPGDEIDWQYVLQTLVVLYGADYRQFSLENSLDIDAREGRSTTVDTALVYGWRTYPRSLLGRPRLQWLADRGSYFAHAESVTFSSIVAPEEIPPRRQTVILGHETALVIPDRGRIRAYADIGFGVEPFELEGKTENQYLLGLQGGIEGQLTY